MSDTKIVVIGGGTGLSTMLRGLKKFSKNITAIVTVSDNGGGSGVLREEMNMLPPGDIRNCILALSNTEPTMEKLFKHRFNKGYLSGQSFGNLFLAAMNDILGSFEEAVKHTGEVLAITGKVIPVTNENVQLCAKLEDDTIICGETQIVDISKRTRKQIEEVYLIPKNPKPAKEVIEAIEDAEIIVMGPGSLYTSVIPNLLVENVAKAIKKSSATKFYISNIMTQPGETNGFTMYDHVKQIESYIGDNVIDYVISNSGKVPDELLGVYKEDGAEPVYCKEHQSKKYKFEIIEEDIIKIIMDRALVRHDCHKLAEVILNTYDNSSKNS